MKKNLFYFAIAGWILELIVHFISLAGIDISDKVPFIGALHIGIFLLYFLIYFDLKKNEELETDQIHEILKRRHSDIFRRIPIWLTVILIVSFIYAMINFLLFIGSQHGVPLIQDGQYILYNHGLDTRTLTEQEYHHYKANELRGTSGHMLVFYGYAAAFLFPFSRQATNE